ncbi:hypothetical protein WR25_17582 [Diploscapter pachys]|uniref:Uncharacterized protein n=1 Tax=Diploscapter pachys TaxID=2018661 RepID=A0A2A2J363_9BILA|nr:hypothetical protein WR25_17582 [Diploscapter pachys]
MFLSLVVGLLIAGATAKPELTPQNNGNKILFYGPNPPEWRKWASVAYFKDKLYYLGGLDPETYEDMNRVDMDNGKQDLPFLLHLLALKQ